MTWVTFEGNFRCYKRFHHFCLKIQHM